MCELKG